MLQRAGALEGLFRFGARRYEGKEEVDEVRVRGIW